MGMGSSLFDLYRVLSDLYGAGWVGVAAAVAVGLEEEDEACVLGFGFGKRIWFLLNRKFRNGEEKFQFRNTQNFDIFRRPEWAALASTSHTTAQSPNCRNQIPTTTVNPNRRCPTASPPPLPCLVCAAFVAHFTLCRVSSSSVSPDLSSSSLTVTITNTPSSAEMRLLPPPTAGQGDALFACKFTVVFLEALEDTIPRSEELRQAEKDLRPSCNSNNPMDESW